MAKFLPNSMVYGSAKRVYGTSSRRNKVSEIQPEDLWRIIYAVKGFVARRKAQKARAEFYKKHGFYKQ
jgi:hypothetical protein